MSFGEGDLHVQVAQLKTENAHLKQQLGAMHGSDRDYMKLPVDEDGVPWTIADKKFADILGETHTITGILYSSLTGTWYLRDAHDVTHNARQCRHVEPRTIKDVLREFAEKAVCGNQYGSLYADEEEIAKYADELRGMMEVDA